MMMPIVKINQSRMMLIITTPPSLYAFHRPAMLLRPSFGWVSARLVVLSVCPLACGEVKFMLRPFRLPFARRYARLSRMRSQEAWKSLSRPDSPDAIGTFIARCERRADDIVSHANDASLLSYCWGAPLLRERELEPPHAMGRSERRLSGTGRKSDGSDHGPSIEFGTPRNFIPR